MTQLLLILLCVSLFAVYLVVRPRLANTGPFLVDSFLIGVVLYAAGACAVLWTSVAAHADDIQLMALVALISAMAGAIAFSILAAPAYAKARFAQLHTVSRTSLREGPLVAVVAVLSTFGAIFFIYSLFTSPIISQFLSIENIIRYSTLSFARNAIASGSAGYMAPGFVKQVRDILLPLTLFAMVLILPHPFRKWRFWIVFAVTAAAMLVNGQRTSIIVLVLGLGIAVYYARKISRVGSQHRRMHPGQIAVFGVVVFGFWLLLSLALGRGATANSSLVDLPADAAGALFNRVATTLPTENASTYPVWSKMGPTDGKYWAVSFGSIFKTNLATDSGLSRLSNLLSEYRGASELGDSPLGLPPDIWMNWGWTGLFVVPLLYVFFLGLLDMLLLSEYSPLFFAMKIYLFIVLPICVSPYLFILNGGAICVLLIAFIKIAEAARAYLPRKEVLVAP